MTFPRASFSLKHLSRLSPVFTLLHGPLTLISMWVAFVGLDVVLCVSVSAVKTSDMTSTTKDFIYCFDLFIYKRERSREREGDRKRSCMHPTNPRNSWGWTMLESGAQISLGDPTRMVDLLLCVLHTHLGQELLSARWIFPERQVEPEQGFLAPALPCGIQAS